MCVPTHVPVERSLLSQTRTRFGGKSHQWCPSKCSSKGGTNPKVQTIWFLEGEGPCPKSKQRLIALQRFCHRPVCDNLHLSQNQLTILMIPCPMPSVRVKGSSCFNNPKSRSVTGIKKYPASLGFCRKPVLGCALIHNLSTQSNSQSYPSTSCTCRETGSSKSLYLGPLAVTSSESTREPFQFHLKQFTSLYRSYATLEEQKD